MKIKPIYYEKLTILIVLFLLPIYSFSSDLARERRIAEQTLQTLFIGEELWLDSNGTSFLALYEKVKNNNSPAILLIHGTGQGPDTTTVIGPLREAFTERNISTLSLQMPVLDENAKHEDYAKIFPDAVRRISAGANYLSAQGSTHIIVIGHSMGASMLINWLSQVPLPNQVKSIITLGLDSTSGIENWPKINVPFYDIIGGNDYERVLKSAPNRLNLTRLTHQQSKQIFITGADHFYSEKEVLLANKIIELID